MISKDIKMRREEHFQVMAHFNQTVARDSRYNGSRRIRFEDGKKYSIFYVHGIRRGSQLLFDEATAVAAEGASIWGKEVYGPEHVTQWTYKKCAEWIRKIIAKHPELKSVEGVTRHHEFRDAVGIAKKERPGAPKSTPVSTPGPKARGIDLFGVVLTSGEVKNIYRDLHPDVKGTHVNENGMRAAVRRHVLKKAMGELGTEKLDGKVETRAKKLLRQLKNAG